MNVSTLTVRMNIVIVPPWLLALSMRWCHMVHKISYFSRLSPLTLFIVVGKWAFHVDDDSIKFCDLIRLRGFLALFRRKKFLDSSLTRKLMLGHLFSHSIVQNRDRFKKLSLQLYKLDRKFVIWIIVGTFFFPFILSHPFANNDTKSALQMTQWVGSPEISIEWQHH